MSIHEMQAYLDSLPVSDEVTDEERQAWAEGLAEIAAGRVSAHADVMRRRGLDGGDETPDSGA
jgi:predicted transcriptional regulator